MKVPALPYLLIALLLGSCKKDEADVPVISGKEYYPLEIGSFVVYEADSTVYTEIPKDTLHYSYQIKEKIEEKFTDAEGNESFRMNRYIKLYNPALPYDSMSWTIKEAWMIKAESNRIVVQENNLSFVKLIFPCLKGAQWNGNAFNSLDKQNYSYEFVDQNISVNGRNYEKGLKVNQYIDTVNFIKLDLNFEQYAAQIGLVYRQNDHLESTTITPGVPVQHRIEKGYTYRLKLLNYGKE